MLDRPNKVLGKTNLGYQSKRMLLSSNYIEILQHELDKRIERNSQYSMRAFANLLGISPASLSNVLRGQKGLSEKSAKKICTNLEFNQEDSQFFCALVNSTDARSKEAREEAKRFVSEYLRRKQKIVFGDEILEITPNLLFFVLMEILKIKKVEAPLKEVLVLNKFIATSLEDQQEIINRMLKIGIVEIVDGFYKVKHETFLVPDRPGEDVLKDIHFKSLEIAKSVYHEEPLSHSDYYMVVTPMHTSTIKEVGKKMRAYADEMMYEYGSPSEADSVYAISTYVYPLEKGVK